LKKNSLSLSFAACACLLSGAAFADGTDFVRLDRIANEAGSVAKVKIPAQTNYIHLMKGTTEFNISGTAQLNNDSFQNVNLLYAPFLSRNLQWGLSLALTHFKDTTGTVGGVVNYYPGTEDRLFYPYFGGAVALPFGTGNHDIQYGGQAGVKLGLSSDVAVTGEFEVRRMNSRNWSGAVLGLSYFASNRIVSDMVTIPTKGSREFGLTGDLSLTNPIGQFLALSKGWFLSDSGEAGVIFSFDHFNHFKDGNVGVFYDYHFRPKSEGCRYLPYVGLGVGTSFGDGQNSSYEDVQAGLKWYFSDHVALNPYLDLTHMNSGSVGNKDNLAFRLGLIFYH